MFFGFRKAKQLTTLNFAFAIICVLLYLYLRVWGEQSSSSDF